MKKKYIVILLALALLLVGCPKNLPGNFMKQEVDGPEIEISWDPGMGSGHPIKTYFNVKEVQFYDSTYNFVYMPSSDAFSVNRGSFNERKLDAIPCFIPPKGKKFSGWRLSVIYNGVSTILDDTRKSVRRSGSMYPIDYFFILPMSLEELKRSRPVFTATAQYDDNDDNYTSGSLIRIEVDSVGANREEFIKKYAAGVCVDCLNYDDRLIGLNKVCSCSHNKIFNMDRVQFEESYDYLRKSWILEAGVKDILKIVPEFIEFYVPNNRNVTERYVAKEIKCYEDDIYKRTVRTVEPRLLVFEYKDATRYRAELVWEKADTASKADEADSE